MYVRKDCCKIEGKSCTYLVPLYSVNTARGSLKGWRMIWPCLYHSNVLSSADLIRNTRKHYLQERKNWNVGVPNVVYQAKKRTKDHHLSDGCVFSDCPCWFTGCRLTVMTPEPSAKQCNVQEQPVHWVHWAVLWKEGEITAYCSPCSCAVQSLQHRCDRGNILHLHVLYTPDTLLHQNKKKHFVHSCPWEHMHSLHTHPVVHVPALRCMHEANANCTPTHSHTDKSHANTRQVHTYHAPASQSAPWFPPDLGAKIRTSELKIHYGSMGGGSAERRAVGEEDKNESMLSRQGLRGKRGSWLKGEEREWGSEWERAGGKQKHWGVGLSAWWDI